MMFPSDIKVWVNSEPTDMRKAINGLSYLVVDAHKSNPQNGDLFIFYNRRRNMVKILYWHYNGLCLLSKRLEKGSFQIPLKLNEHLSISENQLNRLVEGLHFINKPEEKYDIYH